MLKEKLKLNVNPVGATIGRPHFEGIAKKHNGITLIALIITIIVMLILVGVSVTVALNGGLFTTAKETASQTQIEKEREQLLDVVFATLGNNGKVNLDTIQLPDGFEMVSSDNEKVVYKGPSGNQYEVSKTTGAITNAEEKDLGEYYLRVIKMCHGMIEASEEELEKISILLENLSVEGKCALLDEIDTGIEGYYEVYFYIDGYIIGAFSDERGKEAVVDAYIMSDEDEEYDRVSAILKEKLDIYIELKNLLMGYTYTSDINYIEFEEYVESKLEREFDFNDKGINSWRLYYKSSIDDSIIYKYYIEATDNLDFSYIIDEVSI